MRDLKLIPSSLNKNQRNKAKKNLRKRYLRIVKLSLEKITKIIKEKECLTEKDIYDISWSLNGLDKIETDLTDRRIDELYEGFKRLYGYGIDDQSDFSNWCYYEEIFEDILKEAEKKIK